MGPVDDDTSTKNSETLKSVPDSVPKQQTGHVDAPSGNVQPLKKRNDGGLRPAGTLPGLAQALQGTGYTLKELSDAAGISEQSLRRALKASAPSSSTTLERIVKAANASYLKDNPFSFKESFKQKD